jgi:hypothetical protein
VQYYQNNLSLSTKNERPEPMMAGPDQCCSSFPEKSCSMTGGDFLPTEGHHSIQRARTSKHIIPLFRILYDPLNNKKGLGRGARGPDDGAAILALITSWRSKNRSRSDP